MKNMSCNWLGLGGAFVLGAIIAVAAGFVIGSEHGKRVMQVSAEIDTETVIRDTGETFVEQDGKTWISVPGKPVTLTVINDPNCGAKCDTAETIENLKQIFTRALVVNEQDIEASRELIAKFKIETVPAFVFGETLDSVPGQGGSITDQLASALVERDDEYFLRATMLGIKPGKFIDGPQFADLDSEPQRGESGKNKLMVVEFTDLQCPYCKRLRDNTADVIEEYVEKGLIHYVMKDFPLSFHIEAKAMHQGANCALKLGSQDQYWAMYNTLFDRQGEFRGKGDSGARDFVVDMGIAAGFEADDFRACMVDTATQQEITADIAEGQKYGVTGTPALFIGEQNIPGAISEDQFRQIVEQELAK